MRNLAKELGVSVATVSRALSRPDMLSGETVAKVSEAALARGFSANENAKNLIASAITKGAATVPTIYIIARSLGLPQLQ